jgi:hypothetical protein
MFDSSVFLPNPASSAPWPNAYTPSGFTPRCVRWSTRSAPSGYRARGIKRLGLAYERRVLDVLSAIYGRAFTPSPVIDYLVGGRRASAIPDGILRLDAQLWILEVKLAHTPLVWPQLMERYLPLVCNLEPRVTIRTVEICRSYDPGVLLPGRHTLIDSLHTAHRPGLEVIRWKI